MKVLPAYVRVFLPKYSSLKPFCAQRFGLKQHKMQLFKPAIPLKTRRTIVVTLHVFPLKV